MTRKRFSTARAGFTLVEVLIVVLIVGTLSALATHSLNRYTAQSKAAEALSNVGAIGRAVHAAAALGVQAATEGPGASSNNGKGKGKGNGATVTTGVNGLCNSAEPVPASLNQVAGKKYQPAPADYATGGPGEGWACLSFTVTSPQRYRYHYNAGGPPVNVNLPHGGTPAGLDKDHT